MVGACRAIDLPLAIAGNIGPEEEIWLRRNSAGITWRGRLDRTGIATLFGVSPLRLIGEAAAQSASAIATPSPLGDMALGPADAKVTVIEYASMNCPHCAAFTVNVFPKTKSDCASCSPTTAPCSSSM